MVVVCVETYLSAAGVLPGLSVGTPANRDSITADAPASVSTLER